MTSNVETKEFKEESQSFVLKKIGKYWILKTNTSSKRLAFLDDAKYVKIEENILIADERLFEIHKNEKGEHLFRHLEDVACETYFSVTESSPKTFWKKIDPPEAPIKTNKDNSEMDLYDYSKNEQVQIQHEKPSERRVNEDYYEEIDFNEGATGHFELEHYSLPKTDNGIQHLDTQPNSSADTNSCHDDDLNIGSVSELMIGSDSDLNIGSAAEMMEGHEKYEPLEVGSTEVDSVIDVVDMTQNPSGDDEFHVIIEPSDLTKMCGMEGEMTLSIKDNALIFKDINNANYRFPFPLIRRFGTYGSSFYFEVGRKCPYGAGGVYCTTLKANQIKKKCLKEIREKNRIPKESPTRKN